MDKRYVVKWTGGADIGYFVDDDEWSSRWTVDNPGCSRKIFTTKAAATAIADAWKSFGDLTKVLRLRRKTKGYVIRADIPGCKDGVSYFSNFADSNRRTALWTDDGLSKRKVFTTKSEAQHALTAWVGGVPDFMKIVRLVARKRDGNT